MKGKTWAQDFSAEGIHWEHAAVVSFIPLKEYFCPGESGLLQDEDPTIRGALRVI